MKQKIYVPAISSLEIAWRGIVCDKIVCISGIGDLQHVITEVQMQTARGWVAQVLTRRSERIQTHARLEREGADGEDNNAD